MRRPQGHGMRSEVVAATTGVVSAVQEVPTYNKYLH